MERLNADAVRVGMASVTGWSDAPTQVAPFRQFLPEFLGCDSRFDELARLDGFRLSRFDRRFSGLGLDDRFSLLKGLR